MHSDLMKLESAGAGELRVIVEFVVPFRGSIAEPGKIGFPSQFNITNRAVTLFCNDDFGLAGELSLFITSVVILFAMHKHDDVSILFDRARFAQVTETRSVVFAIFGLSIELRKAKQRDTQFSRDAL